MIIHCKAIAFQWTGDNEEEWIKFVSLNQPKITWSIHRWMGDNKSALTISAQASTDAFTNKPAVTVDTNKWLVFADTEAFPQIVDEIKAPAV